jgi:cardiolipin synthase
MSSGAGADASPSPWSRLPNAICVLRILMVLPIVRAVLAARYTEAAAWVCLAGFSDGLDGFLAKHFDWRSRIGGLLDALADKLLLISVYATLAWCGLVPAWLLAVVVGRDLVIVSGGVAYNFLVGPVQPEPSRVSKLNTLAQLLYVLAVFARAITPVVPPAVPLLLGSFVFCTTVVSGLHYVLRWSLRAVDGRSGLDAA